MFSVFAVPSMAAPISVNTFPKCDPKVTTQTGLSGSPKKKSPLVTGQFGAGATFSATAISLLL
jgi:hypothetical protein